MQIRQLRFVKTDMRTLLKISASIALASMFLAATLAYPKNSDKRIMFKGFLQGTETDVLQGSPPDSIAVDGNIPGLATHLSEFTYSYKVLVNIQEGSATGT